MKNSHKLSATLAARPSALVLLIALALTALPAFGLLVVYVASSTGHIEDSLGNEIVNKYFPALFIFPSLSLALVLGSKYANRQRPPERRK